jgi:DNA-binding PadR family transcriptional regulator
MFRHFHVHGDVSRESGPARFFEKGDLKYVILDLLKDQPAHGYEIIRRIEDSFNGFYSPSAGSVYPTLQLLEDMGYITSAEQDGKKVYTITEEGKKFLQERAETINKIKDHMHGWWMGPGHREDFRNMMHEFRGLVRDLVWKSRTLEPEKMEKVKDILQKARQDIEAVIKK